jgi:hypothetical protein
MEYRIQHRAKKWYITTFWYLMKFCVVNAWKMKVMNTEYKGSQNKFIRELYCNLRQLGKYTSNMLNASIIATTSLASRYDSFNHWMVKSAKKKAGRFCTENHISATSNSKYICQKCNCNLHVQCFVKYHVIC